MHVIWEFVRAGASAFSAIVALLALFVSIVSFAYVMHDRRTKLVVRARKGDWYVLDPAIKRDETIFRGVIEIYNHSSRPNTVCDYHFRIDLNGVHETLESEMVEISERDETANPDEAGDVQKFNVTPLVLAPYAGVEAPIHAIIKGKHALLQDHLPVIVVVEDVFGRCYSVEVKAKRFSAVT
jgi:hypothetical protein